jgi:hypothetical protein
MINQRLVIDALRLAEPHAKSITNSLYTSLESAPTTRRFVPRVLAHPS